MKPVSYKGKTIEIRRDGWDKDADGREAVRYAVLIDGELQYTCVPLPYASAVFDSTIETAQEIIDADVSAVGHAKEEAWE